MTQSQNGLNKKRKVSKCQNGFSLIEVMIAIGVMAVALVPMVSLLPVGLKSYHRAEEASLGTQIVQRIVSDMQQANFSAITSTDGAVKQFPLRYFDDQGNEKINSTDAGVVYEVACGTLAPASLVGDTASNLAQITIDVVYNPSRLALTRDANTGGTTAATGIVVSHFTALVARN